MLKRGLVQCVTGGRCRFMIGREFNLGDHARALANKKILDEVVKACKEDSSIELDLTFLLRNAQTLCIRAS